MDPFVLKLVLSFFVGGIWVAILSFLAEKYRKLGGAIIGLPSILAISLLFIGWTQSVDAVVKATDVVPIAFGIMLLTIMAYIHTAQAVSQRTRGHKRVIFASAAISVVVWFVLSLLIINSNVDFFYSVLGFIAILLPVAYISDSRKTEAGEGTVHITMSQLLFRSVFSGLLISLAVYLSNTMGPVWGGVLATFPAAYLSSLIILHYTRGPKFLHFVEKTAYIGAFILTVYAISVRYLYPSIGLAWGTLASYVLVFILLLLFWKIKK